MAEMPILWSTPSKCSVCLAFSLVFVLVVANGWVLLTVEVDSLKIGCLDARANKGFRSVQFSTSSPLRGRKLPALGTRLPKPIKLVFPVWHCWETTRRSVSIL